MTRRTPKARAFQPIGQVAAEVAADLRRRRPISTAVGEPGRRRDDVAAFTASIETGTDAADAVADFRPAFRPAPFDSRKVADRFNAAALKAIEDFAFKADFSGDPAL